jgi:hypothetical protein
VRAILVLSAILISGVAAGFTLSTQCLAQNDELDAAIQSYQDCLYRAAAQHDDLKSDPAAVAGAIMPMCAQEYAAEKTAWGKHFSDLAAAQAEFSRMDALQPRQAAEVVLKGREDKARRN